MADPAELVRELIERWGWIQDDWQSSDGFCILGAFEHLYGVAFVASEESAETANSHLGSERFTEALGAVRRVAREAGSNDPAGSWQDALGAILAFNDAGETSYEDVMLVLKRAVASECHGT